MGAGQVRGDRALTRPLPAPAAPHHPGSLGPAVSPAMPQPPAAAARQDHPPEPGCQPSIAPGQAALPGAAAQGQCQRAAPSWDSAWPAPVRCLSQRPLLHTGCSLGTSPGLGQEG